MQGLIYYTQDTVRYSDVFGPQSLLLEYVPQESHLFEGYGTIHQIAITLLVLVYIYLVTRYFSQIKQMFSQIFGERYIQIGNKNSRISLQFTGWYFVLLGILTATLFVPRIQLEYLPLPVDSINLAIYTAGVLVLYILWQLLYSLLLEFITEKRNFSQKVIWYKLKYAAVILVLVLPWVLFYTITQFPMKWSLYVVGVIVSVFAVIYSLGILNLFQKSNISKFYWILYLCTSDLLPISLIFIPLVKDFS